MLLRPHRLGDVDDIFEFAVDPEWGRYLPVPIPYLKEHAVQFVERRIRASWPEDSGWAMVLEGKVVGGIGLRINDHHSAAVLGYSVARQHWGKGLTVEAARAVIDWGFRKWELAKVKAYADARNVQSLRVMEKLGMRREGTLRNHREHRDERVDDVHYVLLREEWESGRG